MDASYQAILANKVESVRGNTEIWAYVGFFFTLIQNSWTFLFCRTTIPIELITLNTLYRTVMFQTSRGIATLAQPDGMS